MSRLSEAGPAAQDGPSVGAAQTALYFKFLEYTAIHPSQNSINGRSVYHGLLYHRAGCTLIPIPHMPDASCDGLTAESYASYIYLSGKSTDCGNKIPRLSKRPAARPHHIMPVSWISWEGWHHAIIALSWSVTHSALAIRLTVSPRSRNLYRLPCWRGDRPTLLMTAFGGGPGQFRRSYTPEFFGVVVCVGGKQRPRLIGC